MKKICMSVAALTIMMAAIGAQAQTVATLTNKSEYLAQSESNFIYLDHLLVHTTGKNFHINRWLDEQYTGPFVDKNGRIYPYGIGMWSDNYSKSGIGYADYQINGAYSRFEATLALEKRWLSTHL